MKELDVLCSDGNLDEKRVLDLLSCTHELKTICKRFYAAPS